MLQPQEEAKKRGRPRNETKNSPNVDQTNRSPKSVITGSDKKLIRPEGVR